MLNIWTKRSTRCNYPWFNLLLVSNLALVIKKKNFWALSYVVSCQMFGCIFGCIVVEILIRRFTMPRSFFYKFSFRILLPFNRFFCIIHSKLPDVWLYIFALWCRDHDQTSHHGKPRSLFFLCFPFASCYPLTFLLHNSDRWHRNQRNFKCISSYKKGRWNNLF